MRARDLPERIETWSGCTIVCFGAHPGDDVHAAGTFARLRRRGNDVHLVTYANGDAGSRDPRMTSKRLARIRRAEQEKAARRVGIAAGNVHLLGQRDGELAYGDRRALVQRATAWIRRLSPHALFALDPGAGCEPLRDAGSRAAALATYDAVRAARGHLHFPELLVEGLEPWSVPVCFFFHSPEPNYWVDVASAIDAKIDARCAHVSQLGRRVEAYEASMHPEDRARCERAIRDDAARAGQPHGMAYAEAFRRSTDA
ncbi:MAG: hypothetical protein DCC71_09250 [Proteobacteria bacterium]|nr:MAG: hypothetical protein DCC71_09250 [Pseudomonadota bacterium]